MTTTLDKRIKPWSMIMAPLALALAAAACGDEELTTETEDGANDTEGPLYAVPTEIFGPDFANSTSYVPLVPSLDVDAIGLDDAREINGRASVAAIGDWVFMAGSTEPVIDRFEVKSDGTLERAGSLNFSNHGVPEFFSIDPWGAVIISETKAYLFNGSDGSHVIWNPSSLEIEGEIEGPDIVREGYELESIAVVRGNRMYRMFTFVNYDSWEFLTDEQYLAVYDLERDELVDLVEETRCAQLYSRPFIDEHNDIYFSGWIWMVGETLVNDAPKNCALRIRDGEDDFDEDWVLTYADDLTDGREAGILRYLGDGKALLDVFHDERATIDADTSSQDLSNTPNWRLWMVDLNEMSGEPVDGLDYKAGGYQDARMDEDTFLMVPNEDYSETTAYRVEDGQAEAGFTIEGNAYHMVRIR